MFKCKPTVDLEHTQILSQSRALVDSFIHLFVSFESAVLCGALLFTLLAWRNTKSLFFGDEKEMKMKIVVVTNVVHSEAFVDDCGSEKDLKSKKTNTPTATKEATAIKSPGQRQQFHLWKAHKMCSAERKFLWWSRLHENHVKWSMHKFHFLIQHYPPISFSFPCPPLLLRLLTQVRLRSSNIRYFLYVRVFEEKTY